MAANTRPYTVFEPVKLSQAASGVLVAHLAPAIARSAIAALEADDHDLVVARGEFVEYHREGAIRAAYRQMQYTEEHLMAAVAKFRFEPVNPKTIVRVG